MVQRILTMLVVLVFAVGGGYLAYVQIMPPIEEEASGPIYATADVTRGDITVDVMTSGPLNPSGGGAIQGPMPYMGTVNGVSEFLVENILVKDGDSVDTGQTIIRLAAPELGSRIKTAENELETARKFLADLLGVPVEQVDQANPALGITLRATIPGRITNIQVSEGKEVLQGETVARIVDTSRWRADVLLTSAEYGSLSSKDQVYIRFNQFEGVHQAEIKRVNPNPIPTNINNMFSCQEMEGYQSDQGEETFQFMYEVEIEGENPGLIHPGMAMEAGFASKESAAEGSPPVIRWARYCATVDGYSKEERVINRSNGIVTQIFVDEMAVVEEGDPIIAVSGDETQDAIEQNLLKIRQKEEELEALRSQLNQLDVKAPMSGVVANINVQEGQTIHLGEYMGSIYNTSDMRLWVQVDDVDVLRITQDAPVEITVDALPGESFSGRVTDIATAGQNESGITLFQVGITVNGGPQLRPGMQAQARIKSGSAQDVLLIPLESVFEENGQTKVEVLQPDGTPRVVTVELGLMNDQMAEVKSGLEEGQKVVTGSSADVLPTQGIPSGDGLLPISPGAQGEEGEPSPEFQSGRTIQ